MAARPVVSVQKIKALNEGEVAPEEPIKLPSVLLAPIRPDIVRFVHTNMAKNRRQPYAVAWKAGKMHSAESWGTGRAVARIPRVSGGGTHRAGQAAFGNMCRKGRLAAPTKIWRKWHRKINLNQRRYATCSALAATAVPSLVMSRGHRVARVPEFPLVVSDKVENIEKTKKAIAVLKAVDAYGDVEKSIATHKIRAGRGKMRDRRYVQRKGPLVVYSQDNGITRAFRNLPGVDLCHVSRLNLLQLAPGGHLGRFVIWTAGAFAQLEKIYGSVDVASSEKAGYHTPRSIISTTDVARIINSDEVQSVVNPKKTGSYRSKGGKNPLKNAALMQKLNPFARKFKTQEVQKMKRNLALKKKKN